MPRKVFQMSDGAPPGPQSVSKSPHRLSQAIGIALAVQLRATPCKSVADPSVSGAAMRKACGVVLMTLTILGGLTTAESLGAVIFVRTGVDATLTPLGENVADPFWEISVRSLPLVAAEVVNVEVICCDMDTASANARWISDPSVTAGSPSTNWGVGETAIARRTFDLTGFNLSTTSMTGVWRVADGRFGVYLNGVLIDPAT